MARIGAEWCGTTRGKAVRYKAVRDGIVWNGTESRDMKVVPLLQQRGAEGCAMVRGSAGDQ